MNSRKKIPTFKDETAEREFWSEEDSSDYIDWSAAGRVVLPKLKPTLRTISLRLPESMIAELKVLANQRDVPYQSLLKIFLAERLREERSAAQEATSRGGVKPGGKAMHNIPGSMLVDERSHIAAPPTAIFDRNDPSTPPRRKK